VEENPTLQDIWRLLGAMNKRIAERLDTVESRIVQLHDAVATLRGQMQAGFGALKESIEARDFRLDEHARRLRELENPRG
jgi:hypothetical protein